MWLHHSATRRMKFWFLASLAIAALVTLLFLAVSQGQSDDAIWVNLDDRTAVSPVQQDSGEALSARGNDSLRVAIAGVLSASETLEAYHELLTYMGDELNRRVDLILKPTYTEINNLIAGHGVDAAFVCSLAYVEGSQDFGMELLVAPQMYGGTVYYSYLIVPEGSSAATLEDLRGASFAFTDPMSNSGHLAPTYELSLLGETPITFFSDHIFTYSHDNSINAVSEKLVGGAAVDSLVYDQMVANSPDLASRTRIIARWGPYGIPPVVVSPALDLELKQQLRDFFVKVHDTEEGERILYDLGIERFVVVPNQIYDSIREMKTKMGP